MSFEPTAVTLYQLFEDELDREILSAADIDGFFAAEPQPDSALVRFLGTSLPPTEPPRRFEDVELRVVDATGKVMAYYYIGTAGLKSVLPSDTGAGGTDALVSLSGYSLPYPGAREMWRRWASGAPIEQGEWRSYAPELYASWLHVVQQAWFGSGHRAMQYGDGSRYAIDGAGMANIDGFYCALGEAVNGPGGYLGSNPSALQDCLSTHRTGGAAFQLIWQNFRDSEQSIDKDELGYVLRVLRDDGVDLVLA